MMCLVNALTIELPEDLLETLARRVATLVSEQGLATVSRWLGVEEAADYLRTTPDALRKAIQRGQVPAHQPYGPGTRYVLDRDELDAWVVQG
jgi:excisionase family DNA binding protein